MVEGELPPRKRPLIPGLLAAVTLGNRVKGNLRSGMVQGGVNGVGHRDAGTAARVGCGKLGAAWKGIGDQRRRDNAVVGESHVRAFFAIRVDVPFDGASGVL